MRKKQKKAYVGPKFGHVRSSSRYDREDASLRKAVLSYLEKDGVSLHDGSEVSAEKREKVLRKVAKEKEWGIVTGDHSYRDDSYIMWDKKVWDCLYKGTHEIKTGNIFTAKGSKMPKNAIAEVVLEHCESGHRLVWTAGHPPAGVERGGFIQRTRRGMAWRVEVAEQKMRTNHLARKWRADGVGESDDWNADGKKDSNRRELKMIMPRWRISVRPPYPKGGSHGNRWIDFIMFRRALRLIKSHLMKDDNSSDHRPVHSVFQFTKKPKNKKKALAAQGRLPEPVRST